MTEEGGYGKPPEHSRWKKGQSGNPKGRPKGTLNFKAEFEKELLETILIQENQRPRRVTKLRAGIKSLIANAIRGEKNASNHFLRLVTHLQEQAPSTDSTEEDQQILEDLKSLLVKQGGRDDTDAS